MEGTFPSEYTEVVIDIIGNPNGEIWCLSPGISCALAADCLNSLTWSEDIENTVPYICAKFQLYTNFCRVLRLFRLYPTSRIE